MIIKIYMYGVMKMLNYLLDLDISPEEIYDINHTLDKGTIEILEISKNNVKDILRFYRLKGVTNICGLIINRPDLVLLNIDEADKNINKLEDGLFVELVNNNIEDLIVFGV